MSDKQPFVTSDSSENPALLRQLVVKAIGINRLLGTHLKLNHVEQALEYRGENGAATGCTRHHRDFTIA